MKNWEKTLVYPESTIRETIRILDESALQIVHVVDENRLLLGTVTDGDIRRGILREVSLEESVVKVMFKQPTVARVDQSEESVVSLMNKKDLRHIPIVDGQGRIIGLKTLTGILKKELKENWVVLMAGGLGKRLGSMTENCPKPLLIVGDKPLLENILESFIKEGFHKFYLSVNYMAEKIQEYFGDGSDWNIEIRYLKESTRLGTAGALSLLPEKPENPIIVMNGDVLTKVNFEKLLNFHNKHHANATMCVREYDIQIPYGVVRTENQKIKSIDEKPVQSFFINAGIYVIDPNQLQYIPSNSFFNMPDLFEIMIEHGLETIVYPIREYWIDIGRVEDFHKANGDYHVMFSAIDE